jgi:hypothetical protein
VSGTWLLDRLEPLHRLDDSTVRLGGHVDLTMLVDAGASRATVTIENGKVTDIADPATTVMPQWRFALCASADEWTAFWEAAPLPGHHDLFALLRRKQLRIEGDLQPFMSNLLYFKALLARARQA